MKGLFLFSDNIKLSNQTKSTIPVEFYQKKFQDFPIKYSINMNYFVPEYIKEEIRVENEIRMKELLAKSIAEDDEQEQLMLPETQNGTTINVSKIDRKRLSFYDFGYKTGGLSKEER